MKNLIQLFSTIIFIFLTTVIFAQAFGIKGGLNLSTIHYEKNNTIHIEGLKSQLGFNIGTAIEIPITSLFSMETVFIVSSKGYRFVEKRNSFGVDFKSTGTVNSLYFDIPINAKFKIPVGNSKIFATAGPYFGVGLIGFATNKTKIDGKVTEKESRYISWGNDRNEDDFSRLDFGLRFGIGVELKRLEIGLSYSYGFANISPFAVAYDSKINNRVLSLTIGRKFKKK